MNTENINKKLKRLLYVCDGMSSEYCDGNYGNAKEWLRHIDEAYQDWQEAVDDKEDEQTQ